MSVDDFFPLLFELQYADYAEDLEYWLTLARQHGDPVLELGCGIGRVLIPLAEQGSSVTGLDNHPGMLARARARLPAELQGQVELLAGELTDFDLNQRFRLAIVPCNTFAELDQRRAAQTLERLHTHLLPGGMLAFEMPNPPDALQNPPESDELLMEMFDPQTDLSVELYASQSASEDNSIINVRWEYRMLFPDGRGEAVEIPTRYHLRHESDMQGLLLDAGFAAIKFFGDYDGSPLLPDSPRMLVQAKRPCADTADEPDR